MENNNEKQQQQQQVRPTSTPSLGSQLFGSQISSSNDVFASIFPPNKDIGRKLNSDMRGNGNHPLNATQDNMYRNGDTTTYSSSGSKDRNSVYEQDQRMEPCYLSSSLYYGGQETYSNQSTHHSTSTSYSNFKKDGGEDESSGAARGNWWQGSLYY